MQTAGPGGILGAFGQRRAKLYTADSGPSTTFADVAGIDEAKQDLAQVVDLLKTPEKYQRLGAQIPHRILLLRPGRFERRATVSPPDRAGREAILKIHTRNLRLAPDVNLGEIAGATAGFVGADLRNIANEAALLAAQKGEDLVTQTDFDEAF